ncbi:hypothetical protein CD798_08055 [Bacillaceae bacterium SAOS 7]|nr:hypothetical protein CD798_08055 [Bacillaceae bacterium SAOS 7]
MNIIQRVQLETQGIELDQRELSIYCEENGLQPFNEYIPSDNTMKRKIYSTALSILESLSNNPENLRTLKLDDMTVSDFADSILKRIDHLEGKIRKMTIEEEKNQSNNSNIFFLFD